MVKRMSEAMEPDRTGSGLTSQLPVEVSQRKAARLARRARIEARRRRQRQVVALGATTALAVGALVAVLLAVASPSDEPLAVSATAVPQTPEPEKIDATSGAMPASAPADAADSLPAEDAAADSATASDDAAETTIADDEQSPVEDTVPATRSRSQSESAVDPAEIDDRDAQPTMAVLRRQSADLPAVSEGDSGRVVKVAQKALGVNPVSGYFGPQTRKAVKKFQAGMGLPKTGTIATWTWAALGGDVVAKAEKVAAKSDGYTAGSPAPARSTEPPILEQGDTGEAVAVVQRALDVEPASGYFGPKTAAAVRDFQTSVGLPGTGTIATWTWKSLGSKVADAAGRAHATYGTDFGPGAPTSSGSNSSGSNSSGSGSSGSGSSGSGSSGSGSSGSSGSGSSGSGSSGSGGSGSINVNGRFCPAASFTYGQGLGAPRPGGRLHAGLDLMGSRGTPIYAIDGGTVTRSGYQSNGSLILDITGSNGMFFYGHFDSILFSIGQRVKAGQVIGYMGDTGSPGAVHLHLEWRPNGWSGGAADVEPLVRQLCG